MKTTTRTAALAGSLGLLTVLALAAPAAGRVPSLELEPRDLPRGADIATPHVVDSTLVHGDLRVAFPPGQVRLLGTSDRSYVVWTSSEDGLRRARVVRVRPDGSTRTLLQGTQVQDKDTQLSTDGRRLVTVALAGRATTRITSRSARTGQLVGRRALRGYPSVLDARGGRAVVSTQRGTFWLHLGTGDRRRIATLPASRIDLAHGRLAMTEPVPFEEGCTVVTTLQRPRVRLWRSCRQSVAAFSPDGRRMVTVDKRADGLGPSRVWLRERRGREIGDYSTRWFGDVRWESPDTLLLEVNGRRLASTVRCEQTDCENATDPRPVVVPRRG